LHYLDLSYNDIRSLAPLSQLHAPALEELYVANNKVAEIEGISQLTGKPNTSLCAISALACIQFNHSQGFIDESKAPSKCIDAALQRDVMLQL
jgi:Leucine-rich repeat (LRR) protein